MILKYNDACEQVQRLLTVYPKLEVKESDSVKIRLSGTIEVYRSACNYTLQKEYPIELIIPIGNDDLPTVIETSNMIDASYPHRYSDGSLCLETNTAIRLRFIDGFDLVAWMDEFVEPYFFSYEFYVRYGTFPFGERPHGLNGIIHTYQEIFHTDDGGATGTLLRYAAEESYRGHVSCPCGSGEKLRKCHGQYLLPFMKNPKKKTIALADLQFLRKELTAFEQSRRNPAKAK